jgi:FG-GAP-like repeat/Abnormal spindle-like microcephaly-assoc'd, ASPM-SPD-2-Hydin
MNRIVVNLAMVAILSLGLHAQSNPVPAIDQPLSPDHALPGSAVVTLTVNGSGFVSGSVVDWNGLALSTTFINKGQVQAVVPASNLASAGTAAITVSSPAPGGGSSNVVYFPVGNPNAKFALAKDDQSYFSGWNSVLVGDYNGDGKLDMAVAGYDAGIEIYLGNGDGTFQAPTAVQGCQVNTAQSMAQGDFNGDGILDLVTTGADFSEFCVSLGKGDGTFTLLGATNGARFAQVIAVGDFNGDGKLDVVEPDFVNDSADVYLGNGDGTFQNAIEYPAGIGYPFFVTVGDFNGDGIADIAVISDGATFSVLLGNGSGGFNPPIVSTSTNALGEMWAADVNGDGKLDLIAVGLNNGSSNVAVFLGNGNGTFQPEVDYAVPEGLAAIAVGDFNGDGILDLASVSGVDSGGLKVLPPGSLSYLFGKGDGTFSSAVNYVAPIVADAIAVGDFNNDGLLDVATASGIGSVSTYLQTTLAVSAFDLNFVTQTLNTSSPAKSVKLTNNGDKSVAIHSITITSPVYASDFSQSNNCGASLAAKASCTIDVTFTPNTVVFYPQPLTAALVISSTAPGPQSVDLSGAETVLSLSPAALNFGIVTVGQSSAPMNVTLTNLSATSQELQSEKFVGADKSDFAQTNNCGHSLAANSSCTISVTFTPGAVGSRSAEMTPLGGNTNSPYPVFLSGTGQ